MLFRSKLSDFGAQFKELARDIGGVAGNLFTILQKKPTVVEPTASAGGAAISGEAAATTAESAALSQNSGAQTTNAGARSANTAATIKETQAINKATQAEYEQAVAMLKSEGLWDSKNKLAENVIKNAARFNASTDSVISKFNEEYVVINKNTFAYRALTAEETELILSGKKYTLNVEGQIVAQKGLNATLFESIAAFARAGLIARTFGLTLEGVSIAARAAQVAVATLEAVLTAGIWLVVGLAIQYVYEKLSKFFDKTKEAKNNTDEYKIGRAHV